MLLKITDKIIRRYVYEQKKQKPELSANQACRISTARSIYTPDALWPVSPQITST